MSASAPAAFAPAPHQPSSAGADEDGWLTASNMNVHVRAAQYAVRGALVLRAAAHARTLALAAAGGGGGAPPLPFSSLTYCNIGNPQELGQPSLSFHRAVLALVDCPALAADARARSLFPADAIARAAAYTRMLPGGSSGAYTNSQGIEGIREEVAAFISARDASAPPAQAADIFLTDGASRAGTAALADARFLARSRTRARARAATFFLRIPWGVACLQAHRRRCRCCCGRWCAGRTTR